MLEEVTLDLLQMKVGLSKVFKHLAQVSQMRIYVFRKDEDIIQVCKCERQSLQNTKIKD